MPTVSNRDFNGHWNERESVGEETLTSKRFKEGQDLNVLPSTHTSAADHIAEEHGYAVTQRFVSLNSYYGYHPVMTIGNVEDCSMDTSENATNTGSNPNNTCGPTEWLASRKRCFDGGMEFDADMMSVNKRVRYEHVPDTTEAAMKKPGFCKGNSILTIGQDESQENIVELLLRNTHGCELFNFFEVD